MIYIFHGENILASRNVYFSKLQILKHQHPLAEIVNLNGDKITLTELTETLEANSLFGNQKIILIEGLFGRRRSKEKEDLIQKLIESRGKSQGISDTEILVYENKPITPAVLKILSNPPVDGKNCRINEFKLNKYLFQFLDALKPGNRIQSIKLLEKTTQTDSAEHIFFMLSRRTTELLLAVDGELKNLSGIYQEWQKQKIIQQVKAWKEKQLLRFHKRLLEVDEAIKTGSTPADLATHLDLLMGSL